MSYRTVTLKDGSLMRGEIPDDVSDDEVRERAEKELGISGAAVEVKKKKEKEEETPVITDATEKKDEQSYLKDVTTDLKRTLVNVGLGASDLVFDTAKTAADLAGIDTPKLDDKERRARIRSTVSSSLLDALYLSDENVVSKETGKALPRETVPGIAAEIGTYVVGGSLSGKSLPKVIPRAVRYGFGALGIEQLLSDPLEGNFANIIKDIAPSVEGKSAIIEYLSSDEDDSVLTQRAKMAASSVGLGVLIKAGFDVTKLTLRASSLFKKKLTDLTKAEESTLVESYLKEAKQGAKSEEVKNAAKAFKETDEGAAQVVKQSEPIFTDKDTPLNFKAFFKRIQQQVFSSRGYFTPAGFAASRESIAKQRQHVSEASHISNRLTIAVSKIEDTAVEAPEVLARSQKALTDNLDFLEELAPAEKISSIASKYKLPKDVAEEIVNARVLIDDLSRAVLGTRAANKETKEAIKNNLGSYLNRSYRLFEDGGFKPSDKVRQDAINFIAKEKSASNKAFRGSAKKEEKALNYARAKVSKILGETSTDKELYDYLARSRYVHKDILRYKGEVPEPIRKLMGEISEPSENILLTIGKLGKLAEESKFYDRLYEMGSKGKHKYIFNPKPGQAYDTSKFSAIISGTNTQLDGMVTTPQMLKAIQGVEDTFNIPSTGAFGRAFNFVLGLKGASQKAKTVYSHQAQIRNGFGGAQFGLANGWLPVMGNKGSNSYASLKNQIGLKGNKEFDSHYEKLQGLGVINTSVKAGEFRALLASTEDVGKTLEWVTKVGEKAGISKKTQQLPEDIYMAVDDYFKINNYTRELNVLKKALPDTPVSILERKAANIVKDTMPNYDLVPKFVRKLRETPFGNFVSFPSEVIRTSVGIARQSSDEIVLGLKGNKEMLKRGSARLSGLIGINAAWSAVGTGSYLAAGLIHEEYEALNTLMERDYSKAHNKVVYRTEEGKIYVNDPTFLDSYATIRNPVVVAAQRIQEGELKGEQLDAYLASAAYEGLSSVLSPYVDPAILSETVAELIEATRDPEGRTSKGKLLFSPDAPFTERVGLGTKHLLTSFVPGSFVNGKQLMDAAFEVPDRKGKTRSLEAELAANVAGLRFTEANPSVEIERAAKGYMAKTRYNLSRPKPDFITSGDRLVELYERRQKYKKKEAQELYRKVMAAQLLMPDYEIVKTLTDSNLNEREAVALLDGRFIPDEPSMTFKLDIYSKTPFSSNDKYSTANKTVNAMSEIQSAMSLSKLIPPAEEEEEDTSRLNKEKGGEVLDVPNTSKEPDERIDKITGMPYNQQAGTAFTDVEDREDPLQRMGFGAGSMVTATTKGKVLSSLQRNVK